MLTHRRLTHSDSEIRANVYKSLMLNTVSLASIYVFDLFLQPLVKGQQRWFHRNIGWFYQVLWLLPVVGMSLYLNVSRAPATPYHVLCRSLNLTFSCIEIREHGAR